jgi:hypothetical protein
VGDDLGDANDNGMEEIEEDPNLDQRACSIK